MNQIKRNRRTGILESASSECISVHVRNGVRSLVLIKQHERQQLERCKRTDVRDPRIKKHSESNDIIILGGAIVFAQITLEKSVRVLSLRSENPGQGFSSRAFRCWRDQKQVQLPRRTETENEGSAKRNGDTGVVAGATKNFGVNWRDWCIVWAAARSLQLK